MSIKTDDVIVMDGPDGSEIKGDIKVIEVCDLELKKDPLSDVKVSVKTVTDGKASAFTKAKYIKTLIDVQVAEFGLQYDNRSTEVFEKTGRRLSNTPKIVLYIDIDIEVYMSLLNLLQGYYPLVFVKRYSDGRRKGLVFDDVTALWPTPKVSPYENTELDNVDYGAGTM